VLPGSHKILAIEDGWDVEWADMLLFQDPSGACSQHGSCTEQNIPYGIGCGINAKAWFRIAISLGRKDCKNQAGRLKAATPRVRDGWRNDHDGLFPVDSIRLLVECSVNFAQTCVPMVDR
jgi:hypothetical protein